MGREYEISNQNTYMDLRTRIENAMPIAKRPMEHSINELPTDLQRCNFIIHEAYSNYEQTEYGYIALCDMSFKVSLIEKNGQIHHQLIMLQCKEDVLI